MENVIHAHHRCSDAVVVTDIPDMAFDFRVVVLKPDLLLFFLVPAEDSDFFDVRSQESAQHRVAKCAGTPGYQERTICKHESCLPERSHRDALELGGIKSGGLMNGWDVAETQEPINEKGLDFQRCDLNIMTKQV